MKRPGYQSDLLDVGYYIAQDQKALLSYSYDPAVMTIDPVSTGGAGWRELLKAYNQFCSDHGGALLLSQTLGITSAIARKAFGERLKAMVDARKNFDPDGRLLNTYFRDLFS